MSKLITTAIVCTLTSLGSPNIISTDADRNEVWVYDRVGTEYVHSESGVGLISLVGRLPAPLSAAPCRATARNPAPAAARRGWCACLLVNDVGLVD